MSTFDPLTGTSGIGQRVGSAERQLETAWVSWAPSAGPETGHQRPQSETEADERRHREWHPWRQGPARHVCCRLGIELLARDLVSAQEHEDRPEAVDVVEPRGG